MYMNNVLALLGEVQNMLHLDLILTNLLHVLIIIVCVHKYLLKLVKYYKTTCTYLLE